MLRYRICPVCGQRNTINLLECAFCVDVDLTSVDVMDDTEGGFPQHEKLHESERSQDSYVKVCECGEINSAVAHICSSCGDDISDIAPILNTQKQQQEGNEKIFFRSVDGQYAFTFDGKRVTIGRECEMSDYLFHKLFVSRIHARVTKEAGIFYLENLSHTNYTYVNNRIISEKTRIQDGDEIGLGGKCKDGERQTEAAYFLVRIGRCM